MLLGSRWEWFYTRAADNSIVSLCVLSYTLYNMVNSSPRTMSNSSNSFDPSAHRPQSPNASRMPRPPADSAICGGLGALISPGLSTYSMNAICAASPCRLPALRIRVYPPCRNLRAWRESQVTGFLFFFLSVLFCSVLFPGTCFTDNVTCSDAPIP